MKPDIRWQALLALAGLALVLMLLSYQVQSAALCSVTVPATGGTFVEGIVGHPSSLNPLLSDPYPVDRELTNLIFDGLVSFDETGQVIPALAENWSVSEDGLTITFELREGLKWHDGQPVSAEDVAFTYGLIQNEDYPGPVALKEFWQSVVIDVQDERTIKFTLPQPYSPFFEAVTRGILPSHKLEGVDVAELATNSFNQLPVGTGPFVVQPGQDWQTTGRLRLTPNPSYWRGGTQIADLEFRFFATDDDLLAAFLRGEIQAINQISPNEFLEIAAEPSARVFTSASPRYSSLFFNLGEAGHIALKSKEVRQAIAYGIDRESLINKVLSGQGIVFEGPYLPNTWPSRPDLLTQYSYQPETSAALLDSAGWVGGDTRSREGQPLTLRLVALDNSEQAAVANEIIEQLAGLGIDVQLTQISDPVILHQTLSEQNFDIALVEVAAPDDPDLYDFWSQEAMISGQNFSRWNNRRASEALEAGRQVFSQGERATYYESFQRQFDADLPAFSLYQHVSIYVLSDNVNQAEIGRVWQPRDRYNTLPNWYLNFRDVTVNCQMGAADLE